MKQKSGQKEEITLETVLLDLTNRYPDKLPETLATSNAIAKLLDLYCQDRWNLKLDIVSTSANIQKYVKDDELDPHIIAFTFLEILRRKKDRPLSRYVIDDEAFRRWINNVNSSFYGSSRTKDFNFAKFYYMFFVLYAKDKELAEIYNDYLNRYEDIHLSNLGKINLIKKYKQKMEALLEY